MRLNEFTVPDPDLDEDWKSTVAGLATAGAMALGGGTAQAAKPMTQQVAAVQGAVAPKANPELSKIVNTVLKPSAKILIQTAQAAGIKGAELAQLIAQCAHETSNFTTLKEFGGSLDFRKYDPKFNPQKAAILGNKIAGDGAKYHGRGFIQLTGRYNYKRAGIALGLPLEKQPELVENPEIAAKVAVWFWQNRVQPAVTNFNDTAQVTKPINSGLRGLEDRHNKFAAIMQVMKPKV